MSRLFNTAADRISAEQMAGFAGYLLGKKPFDCTPKERMAALPAIRSYRNGAPLHRVREVFERELKENLA